jgi:hypothetical protein
MKRRHLVGLMLILVLGLTLTVGAEAAVVGHFTEVEGRVDLMKGGNLPTLPVKVQDGVEPGDVIRTKSLSRAQLKFVDDTVLTIAPESRVAIEEYLYDAQKGQRQAVLQIFRGLVHTVVSKVIQTEKPDFIIKTHTSIVGVRGTSWYTVLAPHYTDFYNESGKLRLQNIFAEIVGFVDLGVNQFSRVGTGLPPTVAMHYSPEDLAPIKSYISSRAGGQAGSGGLGGQQLPSPSDLRATGDTTSPAFQGPVGPGSLVTQNTIANLTGGLYIPPTPSSGPTTSIVTTSTITPVFPIMEYNFSQTITGLTYQMTSSSPYNTATFTSTAGGSGSRTVAYAGSFTTSFLINAVSSQNNTFSPQGSLGSLLILGSSGSVRGPAGGDLTGTMTVTARTLGGTTFNLSGPVTIQPSGNLTFSTAGNFTTGGITGTTTGTWNQVKK